MTSRNVPQPNTAEALVFDICQRSFLSLWAYRNPKQRPLGKELCDVLVVCEPDVLIFSVKDIAVKDAPEPAVAAKRWLRKAVEASCRQIYGAESVIKSSTNVIRSDSSPGLPFPRPATIHRIAIAFGGQGKVGFPFGDFGKGFVHVFDERSTGILLSELNTVVDFVTYLRDKERYFSSPSPTIFDGGEEDLLALYIHGGRKFPSGYDALVIGRNLWNEVQAKREYKRKLAADAPSFIWDNLIELFCRDTLSNNLEFGPDLKGTERAIRTMAREHRFARRILGKSFKEFLDSSHKVAARMMGSPSGVVYVFLAMPHGTPRHYRIADLGNRCFVARGLHQDATTVVGIATERYEKGKGFSLDLVHLYKPSWTAGDQAHMNAMQRELGYFVSPLTAVEHEDEYPTS
jgi:hypothetical protein